MFKSTLVRPALTAMLNVPFVICLLGFHWNAIGATYHVHPNGSDLATSTGTELDPWSLARLQDAIDDSELQPGDHVLFARGQVFTGTLLIRALSGGPVDGQQIFFEAGPGTGELPIFSGSESVNDMDWVPAGSGWPVNSYALSLNAQGITTVYGLFDNDSFMGPARFPDIQDGWLRMNQFDPDLGTGIGRLVDDGLPTIGDGWNNATLVVRYANWGYACRRASHTVGSTEIAFPRIGGTTGGNDWGYCIEDDKDAFTSPGEWFVEPSTNTLYYIAPDGSLPSGVRIGTRKRGIIITTQGGYAPSAHLVFRDLAFQHYMDERLTITGVPPISNLAAAIKMQDGANHDIRIERCRFNQLRIGIDDQPIAIEPFDLNYRENTFQDVYRNALKLGSRRTTVDHSIFDRIGRVVGQAGEDFNGNSAIFTTGDDILLEWNTISDVGGAAITVNGNKQSALRHYVRNNTINRASLMLNDHGAISFDKCDGLTVIANVVDGMFPETSSSATDENSDDRTVGIYYGNTIIANTRVVENIITGCGTGILLDNYDTFVGNVVERNTVFNCRDAQLAVQDVGPQGEQFYNPTYGNTVTDNVLYSLSSGSAVLYQNQAKATSYAGAQPVVDFGTFQNNYYFNPFNSAIIHQRVRFSTSISSDLGDERTIPWTLEGWRNRTGEESGTTRSPLRSKDYEVVSYGPVIAQLSADMEPVGSETQWDLCAGGLRERVLDGAGHVLHIGDCTYLEKTCGACFFDWSTAVPGTYSYQFRLRSDNADALRHAPLYNASTKYRGLNYFGVSSDWDAYELIGSVEDIVNNDFHLTSIQDMQFAMGGQNDASLWLDDLVVRSCTLDATYPEEIAANHRLFYNCPLADGGFQNVGATFNVPGDPGQCWSDVYGTFYAAGDPIALEPWASIVLFRFDPPQTEGTANTELHITGQTIWSENRNQLGRVVVDDGATLTIDGAHIGFAESTPGFANNITVQPGGNLVLKNGATLRSWMGCDAPAAMWDGVKALGTGTTVGAGIVRLESGARISDALCAVLCADEPANNYNAWTTNGTGAKVLAEQAIFSNNLVDVFMGEHTGYDPLAFDESVFDRCTFSTTRALNDPARHPAVHAHLVNTQNVLFQSCRFTNTSGLNPDQHTKWGYGIISPFTTVRVDGGDTPELRSLFKNLFMGVHHISFDPSKTLRIDKADIQGCMLGVRSHATDNLRFTNNQCKVPDLINGTAIGASVLGAVGIEFEENMFEGTGNNTSQAEVGAEVKDGGPGSNRLYNNVFNGFQGSTSGGYSAGLIVRGVNAGPGGANGLQIKCNDFSRDTPNSFDAAATTPNTSIGGQQGMIGDLTDPAGNTFSLSCTNQPEVHLHVNAGASLNAITYWHHNTQPGVLQLLPECTNASVGLQPAQVFYSKASACPLQLSPLVEVDDDVDVAVDAHGEFAVLKEVYGNWKDGGNTFGLIDYINDLDNSSYDVRNRLMLVAPKVSKEAWKEVFLRTVPLNPWHVAQALLANSPLQKEVIAMMEEYDMAPFYKELVLNGQNGGVSMHSIYESELAQWDGERARALGDAVSKVLLGLAPSKAADVLAALGTVQGEEVAPCKLALLLAIGDLQGARDLVDAQRTLDPTNDHWLLQDLYLELREGSASPMDLAATHRPMLEAMAAQPKSAGHVDAQAWLMLLDKTEPDATTVLPTTAKRRSTSPAATNSVGPQLLRAYPNPTTGPVYLVYEVPEGVEQAELRMMDASGRLVLQERVPPKNGIVEVLPGQLASGLHVAALYFDGIRVGTTKIHAER